MRVGIVYKLLLHTSLKNIVEQYQDGYMPVFGLIISLEDRTNLC